MRQASCSVVQTAFKSAAPLCNSLAEAAFAAAKMAEEERKEEEEEEEEVVVVEVMVEDGVVRSMAWLRRQTHRER